MTSIQRVAVARRGYHPTATGFWPTLSASVEGPADFMDYDDLRAGYPAPRARIREIEDVLTNAVVGEDAVFQPRRRWGMVCIRYDATGETETFLLGRGSAEQLTSRSTRALRPLGHAIAGARPGEQRIYSIPGGTGLVTLLKAVPYGMYVAKSPGPQSAHRNQR